MIFQNKMLANVLGVQLLGMACKFKERKENFSPCGHFFYSTQENYVPRSGMHVSRSFLHSRCQRHVCLHSLRVSSPGHSGGQEKKGELATTSLEFEYLHEKSQCEMLIGGDDISNDVLTLGTCFEMFVYIYAHFCFALIVRNLAVQSTGSQKGIGGGIQISET